MAAKDNTVKLYGVNRQEKTTTLDGHTNDATSVQFAPDGILLASGGRETVNSETLTGERRLLR